jgi:hypothetical protein
MVSSQTRPQNADRLLRTLARTVWLVAIFLAALVVAPEASAAGGSVKFNSTEVNEISGAWRLFVTIQLTKAPPTAHLPLKFLFTKTMVYERSLVDGKSEPVTTRTALSGQNPSIESLDVDFADGSGKVFKGTRFDFGLTRQRGYEAGEYKVQIRTVDGTDIGAPQTIILKGDNEVVDRRTIAFNAKDPKIKKIDGVDGGAKTAGGGGDDVAPANGGGDVAPVGSGEAFIPKDAYNHTAEEDINVKPKSGCGCDVPGSSSIPTPVVLVGLGLAAAVLVARRRKAA